jgi:protein-S-isoprenylcysteine O-methyltransferase Ste14
MRALELRVPPLASVVIFAMLMAAMALMVPEAEFKVPAQPLIAVSMAVLGALITVAGVVAFRRQQTTVNPFTPEQTSSLVASGIYRFTRNPMYLGFLLALAGWSLYLANWVAVLLLPVFVAYMNRFQIQPEERALRATFGEGFAEYMNAVRRWL